MQCHLEAFHRKFGLTVNSKPTTVSRKDALLRCNLILEELKELIEASGFEIDNSNSWEILNVDENIYQNGFRYGDTHKQDIVGIADAIADLLYVVFGAAVTYGIDAQAVFDEVHRSNMTKVWEDGTVHRREEDGKILKPLGYSPARIKEVLEYLSKEGR